jgi:hypothetical protein
MNTTEIIYEIARRSKHTPRPMTREEISVTMDLLLDILSEELSRIDGEIRLKRIGILRVKIHQYSGGSLKRGQSLVQQPDKFRMHYYRLSLSVSQSMIKRLRMLP